MIYVYPETRRVGGSGYGPRTRVIRERVVIRDSVRIGRLQIERAYQPKGTVHGPPVPAVPENVETIMFWHPEGPSPLAAGLAFPDTHAFVKAYRDASANAP